MNFANHGECDRTQSQLFYQAEMVGKGNTLCTKAMRHGLLLVKIVATHHRDRLPLVPCYFIEITSVPPPLRCVRLVNYVAEADDDHCNV